MVYLTRSALRDAAQLGDLDTVQRYFRKEGPASTEEEREARRTALGIAAEEGHEAIVRFLLKQGVDPNSIGTEPHSLLPRAVASGRAKIVKWFLDHGAHVNAADAGGRTALMEAASRSDCPDGEWPRITRMLLAAGGDVSGVDSWGVPLLTRAVQQRRGGSLAVARLLLKAGADPNGTGEETRWTPLAASIEADNPEAVRLLIAAGADVDRENDDGDPPLNLARLKGRIEIAALLERAGAVDPAESDTDLRCAIRWGKTQSVLKLLQQGADASLETENEYSPLWLAVRNYGKPEIVQALFDHGARADTPWLLTEAIAPAYPGSDPQEIVYLLLANGAGNQTGDALRYAAGAGKVEMVRLLLAAGADIAEADWMGMTPLQEAAHNGRWEIVALLLDHGADVNVCIPGRNENEFFGDQTPLICAVKSGNYEIARLLLERGANVNAADDGGFTALIWAAVQSFGVEDRAEIQRHVDLIQLLLQDGADLNRHSHWKSTALDYALVGMCGSWYGDDDTEYTWSDVALLLARAGAQHGEPRARWCYRAVSCNGDLYEELTSPLDPTN